MLSFEALFEPLPWVLTQETKGDFTGSCPCMKASLLPTQVHGWYTKGLPFSPPVNHQAPSSSKGEDAGHITGFPAADSADFAVSLTMDACRPLQLSGFATRHSVMLWSMCQQMTSKQSCTTIASSKHFCESRQEAPYCMQLVLSRKEVPLASQMLGGA